MEKYLDRNFMIFHTFITQYFIKTFHISFAFHLLCFSFIAKKKKKFFPSFMPNCHFYKSLRAKQCHYFKWLIKLYYLLYHTPASSTALAALHLFPYIQPAIQPCFDLINHHFFFFFFVHVLPVVRYHCHTNTLYAPRKMHYCIVKYSKWGGEFQFFNCKWINFCCFCCYFTFSWKYPAVLYANKVWFFCNITPVNKNIKLFVINWNYYSSLLFKAFYRVFSFFYMRTTAMITMVWHAQLTQNITNCLRPSKRFQFVKIFLIKIKLFSEFIARTSFILW